jgi:acyl-CoA synthetase (AMP-forming)/AMP-acid ligase II
MPDHPLGRRLADVLDLHPDAAAIEYDGQWSTWREVAGLAQAIKALVVGQHQVGILLRNKPAHVASFLGVLLAGGTVVVINPSRGDDRTRADIEALDLPFIVGEPDDLASLVTAGPTLVSISSLTDEPEVTAAGDGGAVARPGVAVRMPTSGTTGPPKRIDLTYDMLARGVIGPAPDRSTPPTELRQGVAIVNAPLVHIGGVFRVLQCICEARPFALLDRFELDRWADAVRRHRPRAVSLVPAALRMVRSDSRRSGEHPRGHIGHGSPVGRGCRRVHREVRDTRPDVLCGNRVRRRCGRLDTGGLSEVLARQARQRGQAEPWRTAARCR